MNKKISHKLATASAVLLAVSTLSGCATTQLIDGDSSRYQRTTTQTINLVDDTVVAFGKPATQVAGIPSDGVVIVGEKHSYVLTQGGYQFSQLLTNLDPRYIQVTRSLDFYSPKNDGRFQGSFEISYRKVKSDFSKNDIDFVLRSGGTECTTESDNRMNAQRFCFKVPLEGAVYPVVNNLSLLQSKFKSLSRPYKVSIYTETTQTTTEYNGTNPVAKLVLLPFALAFDVITLPIQLVAGFD